MHNMNAVESAIVSYTIAVYGSRYNVQMTLTVVGYVRPL